MTGRDVPAPGVGSEPRAGSEPGAEPDALPDAGTQPGPRAGSEPDAVPGAGAVRRRRRRRVLPALAVLIGASASAGLAFAPWWRRDYRDPLTGVEHLSLNGTEVAGALVPLVLVAAAGLAAALISRGAVRRILGGLVAASGIGMAAAAVVGALTDPRAGFAAALTRPAAALTGPRLLVPVVVAVVVAAGLVVVGGAAVAAGRQTPRRAAAQTFVTPAAQHAAVRQEASRRSVSGSGEMDGAQWWRSLDAGIDPTADASGEVPADAGGGGTPGGASGGEAPDEASGGGGGATPRPEHASTPPARSQTTGDGGYHGLTDHGGSKETNR